MRLGHARDVSGFSISILLFRMYVYVCAHRYVQVYRRRRENLGANKSFKQRIAASRVPEKFQSGRKDEEDLPFLQFTARNSRRYRR